MVKLGTPRREMILGYPGAPMSSQGPYKQEAGGAEEGEVGRHYAAGRREGGRDPEPRNTGRLQEPEREKYRRVFPGRFQKEHSPATP